MTSQIETNTQTIEIKTYNAKKCMKFSKPINKKIYKNKNKSIGFKVINITTLNDDKTIGKLIIPTERLFSFGMTINEFGGEETGYTFPLCLWNRDGVTKDEKIWIDKFNEIIDNCIKHLISVRDDIDREDLEKKDLKKFNPLFWKKETVLNNKGKKVVQEDKTQGPLLYSRVDYSKKDDYFFTSFYDMKNKEIKAKSLIDKRCFMESTIRIDSIHIGATSISLQFRLNDANIEFLQQKGKNKRFTKRPKADPKVYIDGEDEDDNDDEKKVESEDEKVDDEDDEEVEEGDEEGDED